jgi:hypothetical protein
MPVFVRSDCYNPLCQRPIAFCQLFSALLRLFTALCTSLSVRFLPAFIYPLSVNLLTFSPVSAFLMAVSPIYNPIAFLYAFFLPSIEWINISKRFCCTATEM